LKMYPISRCISPDLSRLRGPPLTDIFRVRTQRQSREAAPDFRLQAPHPIPFKGAATPLMYLSENPVSEFTSRTLRKRVEATSAFVTDSVAPFESTLRQCPEATSVIVTDTTAPAVFASKCQPPPSVVLLYGNAPEWASSDPRHLPESEGRTCAALDLDLCCTSPLRGRRGALFL